MKECIVMDMKFYQCKDCGQMVAIVKKADCPIECCGKAMEEIIPGSTDAAVEKHVPVWEVKDNVVTVCVGANPHPMIPAHYIEWVAIKTKQGNQRKALNPGEEPKVSFAICEGDEMEAAFAYCNLHGLWKG